MKKIKQPKFTQKFTQKQCDDLLTPLIKSMFPKCLLCGKKTQVAHHHFKKERCLVLRYNFKNLIPLCNVCHFQMKWEEGILSCRIMLIKGVDWFTDLLKEKKQGKKSDYQKIYPLLKELIFANNRK